MLRKLIGTVGVAAAIAWAGGMETGLAAGTMNQSHEPYYTSATRHCGFYCAGSDCMGPAQPSQACNVAYKVWPNDGGAWIVYKYCTTVPCPD